MPKPSLLPYLVPADDSIEAFEYLAACAVLTTDSLTALEAALDVGNLPLVRTHLRIARERVGSITYAANRSMQQLKAGGAA